MKTVDIRKIYVGEILKQTEVRTKLDWNAWDGIFGPEKSICWDYEKDTQLGLFVRVLGGYKHILTDTIYPKPSKRTGNKYVINPENIEELVKCERELCTHLKDKYQSYNMDISVIKAIEDRLNNNSRHAEEDILE